mmetsp:Transcript_35312/g.92684  ORF Transcript_35312/g.92684 Transcript_35312/m.92684 type:complete len:128 (-) Transcript_35312:139-522(-)
MYPSRLVTLSCKRVRDQAYACVHRSDMRGLAIRSLRSCAFTLDCAPPQTAFSRLHAYRCLCLPGARSSLPERVNTFEPMLWSNSDSVDTMWISQRGLEHGHGVCASAHEAVHRGPRRVMVNFDAAER